MLKTEVELVAEALKMVAEARKMAAAGEGVPVLRMMAAAVVQVPRKKVVVEVEHQG